MRAVHVGIRHEDDLVVAELGEVELLGADAGAQGRDEEPDLLVREHLVVARLLRVDDLAAERQDGLRLPVSPLLGGAARGVTLDEEELPELRVALRAIGQLGRQPLVVPPPLRVSSRALRAASRAWAARTHLSTILRAVVGSSSKASANRSLTICWTRPFTSEFPSLALVCPSNCGSGMRTETTAVSPSRTSSPVTAQIGRA